MDKFAHLMMKKLYIALILSVCSIACGIHGKYQQADENQAVRIESRLLQDDNSSERYIDWNMPSVSSARTEFFTERPQTNAGQARNQYQAKAPARDNILAKAGKVLSFIVLARNEHPEDLFPSGTMSKDHHFIILRKLVI